jgi:hypothetical protein
VTIQQLYCAPLPQRGGVAVGGTGDSVEGGGPTTTGVSSELGRGLAANSDGGSAGSDTPQNNFEIQISPRIRTRMRKCFRV